MDPPLDVSLGIWLCTMCTKKRIQFGIYSISEGIESLLDVKEGNYQIKCMTVCFRLLSFIYQLYFLSIVGADNSKQYFVKYKNLAHVHNRWVSESDIVDSTLQGCDLISKFSKRIHKEKVITCAMNPLVHLFSFLQRLIDSSKVCLLIHFFL